MNKHKHKHTMAIASLAALLCFLGPATASAAVSNWQKGVSISPRFDTDFSSESFKQSVRDLKATNADYVTMIIPYYQSNPWTTDIFRGWNTPTDETLVAGIQYVHSIGMKVNLKIHLETHDGQWRANINPGDRNAWFTAYGNILSKYARIAKTHGVEEMTIGAELINMSSADANGTNTQNWNKLISQVRSLYGGKLTYSANWGGPGWTDEKNRIQFWPSLDYIGVSAYYPIPSNTQTVDAYKAEWDKINNQDIRPLSSKYSKPVLFTEVGYRSLDWTRWAPFEFGGDGNYDPEEQARLYEALYSYWNTQDFMQGVHWWDWSSDPNAGGQGNKQYTPQNKPAEAVMTRWQEGGTSPTPTPTPQPSATFTDTTAVRPASTNSGQPVSITTELKNNGGAVTGAIVDIEVYNANNTQVYQKYYENQSFTTGQTRTYTTSFTPTTGGNYSVRIGVFNGSWTSAYFWNGNAATLSVSQGTPTPNPQPGAAFSDTVTAQPATPKTNQATTISATIKNNGGAVDNSIVDVEVYDSANAKVHQQFYENQAFTSGQTRTYTTNWTPRHTGAHSVRIGVFNNDWSRNYFWDGSAATISVTEGSTTNPPPQTGPTTLHIWWPTDGASVEGTQPFKAMLENMNIQDYAMYWSVDGGGLNEMYNSDEGYPHKEVWVDVGPWNWQGSNQYKLKFTAKDKSGNIIGEKEITIMVFH